MTREETSGYIKHHLALSGRTDTRFSDDATTLIHETGRGLPRTTNNLAVNALIAAYYRRQRHRRPERRPLRDHRSHRDTLSTTRDTPGTTQPRRNPSGGVFHTPEVLKISVMTILKINVAQQEVAATKAQFLVRLTAARRPPVLKHLPDGSVLSVIGGVRVRIIAAEVTVTCADGTRYGGIYRLATTLTDHRAYPAGALIRLYHERWEHEIACLWANTVTSWTTFPRSAARPSIPAGSESRNSPPPRPPSAARSNCSALRSRSPPRSQYQPATRPRWAPSSQLIQLTHIQDHVSWV